jgi:hypothetical protein
MSAKQITVVIPDREFLSFVKFCRHWGIGLIKTETTQHSITLRVPIESHDELVNWIDANHGRVETCRNS